MKKLTPQGLADTFTPRFKEVINEHEQYEPTMIVSKPTSDFTEREKFLIQYSLRQQFDFGRSINNTDRLDMISILEKLGMLDKATEMANDLNS
jgi:hypothetical protein